jgi:hypothetical protein
MKGLFSITYFGPLSYYAALLSCETAAIDANENWQKQSYRNRCYIDSPNGKLMLNIPMDHQKSGKTMKSVVVSADENWRAKHWQALKTTYNLSPFFDEVGLLFKEVLFSEENRLFELNLALCKTALQCLRVKSDCIELLDKPLTENTLGEYTDFRNRFHPKTETPQSQLPYPQVFEHKHGLEPNLTNLDLIYKEGPAA